MLSYLNLLRTNYQLWKKIKALKTPLYKGMISSSTYLKYPKHWDFGGAKVLNFGSGLTTYPAKNVTNLDCTEGENVTVVPPTQIELPFETNTFDLVIANHVIEHLPYWFETMQELARVVKVGGVIEVWVPPISSDSSFSYRDHLNRIGQESFAGCRTNRRPGSNLLAVKEFSSMSEFSKLMLVDLRTRPIVTWWTMIAPDCVMQWMAAHLRNVISEEGYIFIKGE